MSLGLLCVRNMELSNLDLIDLASESEDVGTDIRSSTSISPSPSPSSSSIKPKSIEKANGVAGKGLNGSSSFKSMSNGHINEAKSAVRNRK